MIESIKDIKLNGYNVLVTFERVDTISLGKGGVQLKTPERVCNVQKVFRLGSECTNNTLGVKEGDNVFVNIDAYTDVVGRNSYENFAQAAWSSKSKDKIIVYIGKIIEVEGTKYALISFDDIIGKVE